MPELWGLLLLFIVWGIVTVCGHVSWVMTAAIFKAMFGGPSDAPMRRCPNCGKQTLANGQCSYCRVVPSITVAQRSREELVVTARHLSRLQKAGHMPYEQAVALLKVIETDLARLGGAVPPEVWRELDLKGVGPEVQPTGLVAESRESSVGGKVHEIGFDEPVVEAVVVEEPVGASPVVGAGRERDFVAVGLEVQPTGMAVGLEVQPTKITPSRTLADLLQGFMEESNIRWIEILGGIAIVGCAIGLVFSLRATLAYIPYFPALLFLVFTVCFHGAGLYTLRYWKLTAVSRVILIIALLLVPLSFSAAVALSGQGEAQRALNDPLLITALLVGFSVFGWVAYSGSRELTGEGAPRLTAAILGGCLAQVIINRVATPELGRAGIVGLALLPVAAYLIAALGQIFRAQAWRRLTAGRIEQTFLVLGVSAFALLPGIALLVVKVKPHWGTFVQLAPLLSLVATSVLGIGLVVHLRALAKGLAPLRTAGTAIALIGGAVLIFLGVIVWPRPDLMLNFSLLTGVLLLAIAMKTRLPALHGAAVGVLALAVFIGLVWVQGLVQLDRALGEHWLQAALRGRTSLLMTALAAVVGALGAWVWTKREPRIGTAYLIAAGVFSILSLLIAGWSGFMPLAEPWAGDGDLTGPLFLCYGIALLVIAIGVTSEPVLAAGMALLWIGLIQLLDMNVTAQTWLTSMHLMPERPALVATILEGIILAAIALVLSKPSWQMVRELFWQPPEKGARSNPLIVPLTYGAAVAIFAATPFILWVLPGRFGVHALYAALGALIWSVICIARRWPEALAALQAMGAVATAFAIAAIWSPATVDQLWFLRGGHLQAQLLAMAATAAVWSVVRRFAREGTVLHALLHPEFTACDHLLMGLGVALLTLLAASAALPGFGWELGFGVSELNVQDLPWLDQEHRWRLVWGVAAIGAAFVVALVDRINGWKLVGLSLTGWAGLFLVAQLWQGELATSAAARCLFVGYGAVLMGLFVVREYVHRVLQGLVWLRWESDGGTRRANASTLAGEREWFRYQPLVLGVFPMLVLTIIAVAQHASGVVLRGPVEGTFFDRIGPTVSYAGPLLVGVTIFLGLALAQRQSAFALGGGLLFQLAANLAFILHISGPKPAAEALRWAEGLQWNTIAAAVYSLLWFLLARWLLPREQQTAPGRLSRDPFYTLYVSLAATLLLAVAIWAAGGTIRHPDALPAEMQFLGHSLNLLATAILLLPLLAGAGVSCERKTWVVGSSVIVLTLVAAMPIAALWLETMRGGAVWTGFHALEVGWLVIAAAVSVVYVWQERRTTNALVNPEERTKDEGYAPHHALAACLCGAVVFLALRGNITDPNQPYYSAGATAGVCLVLMLLGTARRSQPYAWASLVAAPLAASLPWFTTASAPLWMALDAASFAVAFCSCLLAAIVVGGWWQAAEIRTQQRLDQTFSPRWRGPLAGHAAIVLVTLVLAIASLAHLLLSIGRWGFVMPQFDWGHLALSIVWLALGIVGIGSLWDRRALFIFPVLLWWLLIACALALAPFRLMPLPMFCLLGLLTAAVFALVGHLWSYGANLAAWGEKAGISDTVGGLTRIDRWLPVLTVVIGALVCCQELGGMLNLNEREYRVASAFAPLLVAYAIVCLAQKERLAPFRLAGLLLAGLSCVYLGWSDLDPGWDLAAWMTRAFRLLMVLGVVTLGYGLVLPRFIFQEAGWLAASQRAGYVSSVLAIATLLSLLGLEIALFVPGEGVAGVDSVQVAAVAVLLVVFIVGLISLAIAPGAATASKQLDRTWFVYAAQVVAGLLFAHLYLCQPGWFDGVLKPYWPYIVMAIAFTGVGLGELFWRLRLPVLAEPFQRTGAFLPVLPILGLWVVPWWGEANNNAYDYTLVMFFAGLMYLILSVVRKSWPAAIAAAVAGNGALWALLKQEGWNILQHPQFWLIPPAISVLAAAHINRHRLKPEYLSTIRYASLTLIYVSSTFEIFLHRAEASLWPPVILALLSLFGALAGVLFQVRAFLYLGTMFMLMAIVSMVWHAARAIDHVWPWWVFGIGMGILILGLMAFFEKNRPQMQGLVHRLRQWEQ